MHKYRHRALPIVLVATLAGCASAPQQPVAQKEEVEVLRGQVAELRNQLVAQSGKIESLETRMGSMGEKVSLTQVSIENILANHKAIATPVARRASDGVGTEPQSTQAEGDPEEGFVADTATQEFRKGQILLDAQKYSEAILAFSSFVDKYPDHALAGSAQYGVGEAYFRQKEYKLCLGEFEKVLTSYDRSPHISETLRDLAEAEEALKMTEQAARHRQLLTSLFPHSPAASLLASASGVTGAAVRPSTTGASPHLVDEALASGPPAAPVTAAVNSAVPTAPLSTAPTTEVR